MHPEQRYNSGSDGRYVPSDDGKYVHIAGKSGPGGGDYTGGGDQYNGGGGQYTGDRSAVGPGGAGGKYTGSSGTVNIISTGSKTTTNSAGSASSGGGTGKSRISSNLSNVAVRPNLGKGAPPNGWNIIKNEKTETIDGYHYL